jgi:hypothetical protein
MDCTDSEEIEYTCVNIRSLAASAIARDVSPSTLHKEWVPMAVP